MSLSADIDSSEDLLGKTVDELQSEVSVSGDTISGTLLYVDDYTGFSGDPAEQAGNYLVVKCTADEGDTIVLDLIGGTHGPVTLDSDGISIGRITSTEQSVRFVASKNGMTQTKTYALSDLTLAPEG
jgi:hypothetical protein